MSRTYAPDEEQFIIRMPSELAERVRNVLRENPSASPNDKSLELDFIGSSREDQQDFDGRSGVFSVGGESFPVSVQDLPAVLESFKAYDGTNLVKSADIGQMLVVRRPGESPPDTTDAPDGITPPLRDVRKKFYRPPQEVDPADIEAVEKALILILSGGGPKHPNMDVQVVEEWVEEEEDVPEASREEI
ncbi:hypothetical protein CYMTET_25183 [Cymbomonas tetramitiformis]|uniref:TAFII55 protein conserved region domain-containing protein n=1 Tax=Cymbomonas tetramitiformis TaxID=36881 RepID=A0AAE0FV36_9CHLO|nr:hypothetical protein CYMTET_25183 [Cymbomonas tetramitiformis]|eukprot:gene16163-19176_t